MEFGVTPGDISLATKANFTTTPTCPRVKHSFVTAPRSEAEEGHYVAIGEWNMLGGLEENLNDSETERVRMVAGDCNAPNALTLPFRVELRATA